MTMDRIIEREKVEDSVSTLSFVAETNQWKTICYRVTLAVIFLSLGGAAMTYAITKSENEEAEAKAEANRPVHSFNLFVNQCSMNGTLTIEMRTNKSVSGDETHDMVTKTGVRWLQSDTQQRLFYQVGLSSDDWQFTAYIFKDQAFIHNKTKCTRMKDLNYTAFLNSFGLGENIKQRREGSLKMEDGTYQDVVVYAGNPNANVTYQGEEPTMMFAYEEPKSELNLGWEAYFPSFAKLDRLEYWFADMQRREPEPQVFAIPPGCPEQ